MLNTVSAIDLPPAPQDVIVSRGPFATDPAKPWRWESKDRSAIDPLFRGRYHFEDCEAAYDDAVAHGHTVVGVRE